MYPTVPTISTVRTIILAILRWREEAGVLIAQPVFYHYQLQPCILHNMYKPKRMLQSKIVSGKLLRLHYQLKIAKLASATIIRK
jgi:hypothetical protein